jgi:hypothetical protein
MRLIASTILLCLLSAAASAQSQAPDKMEPRDHHPEPPMLGIHWARGHANPFGFGGGNPDMTYHKGTILGTTVTQSIFWGTSWPSYSGDKISGLESWYQGVGGTSYAKSSDEYTGIDELNNTSGTAVTSAISYTGHAVDGSAAPSRAPSTSTILAEVCKVVTNPVANGYYAVYVDSKRGSANYCAWHSWGTCGTTPVQFAFFFNLDGDSGCDPQDTSGQHSQGLAALANVSGHELSEARTDPRGAGWFDSGNSENADKCAWEFGTPLLSFANNTEWKIQGNWSNKAYDGRFGFANMGGQKGCIDGGNYPAVAP